MSHYPGSAGYYNHPQQGAQYPQPGYGGVQQAGYAQGYSHQQPVYNVQPPPGVDPQIFSWFTSVDADRSGKITSKELKLALVNGNWSKFSDEACQLMISLFDRDGSGTIDVTEFQKLWHFINQWKASFESYDRDRTGIIEQNELQQAISQMGYRLAPQFYANTIAKFDNKRKGLTLDNFITFCVQLRQLTDAFRARDRNMSGTITINYEDFLSVALLRR